MGSALGALAHRVLALSVLAFVMQVRAPRNWDAILRTTVKELMPGPTGWLPIPWAFQSPVDFALPSALLSPEVLHQATLFRTAAVTMQPTSGEAYTLLGLFSSDLEPILHPWRTWRLQALALVLHRARADFFETDGLMETSTQRAMQAWLLTERPPLVAARILRARLERFRTLEPQPPFARLLPIRASETLRRLAHLPPAIRWALARIWLNGVCTAGRFQQDRSCRLCGAARDRIEHWPRCQAIRGAVERRLGVELGRSPLQFFLLSGPGPSVAAQARAAVLLYSVLRAHDAVRTERASVAARGLVWASVRATLVRFPALVGTLQEPRAPSRP